MKILLINDDGIHAPGLWAAAGALRHAGDVFVVAPDREQSGVGSSLTLRAPVRARTATVESGLTAGEEATGQVTAHVVEGTPGDCCVLALERLVGSVDLVVSGINSGSNLGWDVMVSGTVGGAVQGFVRGFPTIAISVGSVRDPKFEGAAQLLRLIAQRFAENTPTNSLFLNINVPSLPLDQISGVQVTTLGGRSYGESVREEGVEPNKRYTIARDRAISGDAQEGTDIWASKNNRISITPLHIGLGHSEQVPEIERLLSGLPDQLLSSRD